MVGIDTQDISDDGAKFAREFGLTYPLLHDGNGDNGHEFGTHRRARELPARTERQTGLGRARPGRREDPRRTRRAAAAAGEERSMSLRARLGRLPAALAVLAALLVLTAPTLEPTSRRERVFARSSTKSRKK